MSQYDSVWLLNCYNYFHLYHSTSLTCSIVVAMWCLSPYWNGFMLCCFCSISSCYSGWLILPAAPYYIVTSTGIFLTAILSTLRCSTSLPQHVAETTHHSACCCYVFLFIRYLVHQVSITVTFVCCLDLEKVFSSDPAMSSSAYWYPALCECLSSYFSSSLLQYKQSL